MFDKVAYRKRRENAEIASLDEVKGYLALAYIIVQQESRDIHEEHFATLELATEAHAKMKHKDKWQVKALVHKPLSGRTPLSLLPKQPGDEHFSTGQHMVQMPGKGLTMINRKQSRLRSRDHDYTRPNYQYHIDNPKDPFNGHRRNLSKSPAVALPTYDPNASNYVRMLQRKQRREAVAK